MTAVDGNIHDHIEIMTRRLELEKRRLKRLEKELSSAKQTYRTKAGQRALHSARAASPRLEAPQGNAAAGEGGGRPLTAPRSSTLPDAGTRPRSGSGGSGLTPRRQFPPSGAPGRGRSLGSCGRSLGSCGRSLASSCGPESGSQASSADGPNVSSKLLHDRLEVQVKKLNSVRHENNQLKAEVDSIRRQRLQLNGIFERLKVEIKERTAQLADFVEEAAASRTVHGEARHRVAVMRRQREAERTNFKNQVMRIRKDLQDHDFEKKEIEVQLKRASEGVQKKKELIVPEEESGFSEAGMMRRIMKTAFLNCIQRRHIKQHRKSIEVFEQAFATIKNNTGISNIEEIVKIFVNLESRNFSLLTYVNHMNREIEVLEGQRNERRELELARGRMETQSKQTKHEALSDLQKQLQAAELSIADSREACNAQRELIQQLQPLVLEISQRVLQETEELRQSGGTLPGDEPLRLPQELSENTLPEWLEWVETSLGRFRDLIPIHDKEPPFPATAAAKVKQLGPKRLHGHAPQHALVKLQELPSAISLMPEDSASKRAHANGLTATQKTDMLDEETEEEDFAERPLMMKDIRSRAQQAVARRRRRGPSGRPANELRVEDFGGTASTTGLSSSRGSRASPSGLRPGSPSSDNVFGASHRRSIQKQATGISEINEESEERGSEDDDGGSDVLRPTSPGATKDAGALAGVPEAADGAEGRPASASSRAAPRSKRTNQLIAHLESSRGQVTEVSEDELNNAFLVRYKMTRDELECMAERMGIHISNLCFLKQEFDLYDEDKSGYIDARELRSLLRKLGEELTSEELEVAFRDLDSDGSGEVEFFEFVEWFTACD